MFGRRLVGVLLVSLLATTGCKATIKRIAKRILKTQDAAAASSETPKGAAAWSESTPSLLSLDTQSVPRKHPRLFLPALLPGATKRAQPAEKRDEWPRLKDWCDQRVDGHTEFPEGNDYPNPPHIGEGYQGDEYFHAVLNFGLCHHLARAVEPKRAPAYAARAVDVLMKMSEPPGSPHFQDPLRDSGYGIRFFGAGLAIGYDWLYDTLTPNQRTRLAEAIHRWVRAFDEKGFANSHPQGNYFAGYYAAKAYAALALEGDSTEATGMWTDWLDRLHGKMVQPYYAKYLAGGGWPEGWNYGPLATLNMSLPIVAVEIAKGIDLLKAGPGGYSFPLDQADQLLHYTWPSKKTLDDRGDQTPGENPSRAPPYLYTAVAGLLEYWKRPNAALFHRYAREVRDAEGGFIQPWISMLLWDERASEADFRAQPKSFVSKGMQTLAMRSSWEPDAVWADFTSGPYVNNPDSGEMFFDQGALTIVKGDRALLVNTPAALYRHRPGSNDGEGMFDLIYADLFGDPRKGQKNRTLFNIYYVKGTRYGQIAPIIEDTRTHLDRVEDRGVAVVARGVNLEDLYYPGPKGSPRVVDSWTRQIVYVRPGLFVIDDQTKKGEAGGEQWLAFHLPSRDTKALRTILPAGAKTSIVDVFNKKKVFRVEVRPAKDAPELRWLHTFDAEGSVTRADVLAETHVTGAVIDRKSDTVVVASIDGDASYALLARPTLHVLTGLQPNTLHAVSVSGGRVAIAAGSGQFTSSANGTLLFKSTATGIIESERAR